MSRGLRLLYIAEGGIFLSVFDSQVKAFLSCIRPHVAQVNLLVLEPYQQRRINDAAKNAKVSELKDLFDRVTFFKMPPVIGLPSIFWASKKIIRHWFDIYPDIIHCRGHIGSYIGLTIRDRLYPDVPLIADIRGVTRQEFLYIATSKLCKVIAKIRTSGFNHIEHLICKRSDHILCVSENLSDYLVKASEIAREKITVVPTYTGTNIFNYDPSKREQMRVSLGIKDRIVFIYSGSLAPWQRPKETIELFKEVKQDIRGAFLLFLTTEPEKANALFSNISTNDYLITSAKYSEVSSYLNAADIGILLREKHIVNEVAAPVKIGEYLCCGLPLVISSGIGDTEKHLKEYNLGLIYNENEQLINELHKLLKLDRNYISQIGRQLYGLDTYVPKILEIYGKIK